MASGGGGNEEQCDDMVYNWPFSISSDSGRPRFSNAALVMRLPTARAAALLPEVLSCSHTLCVGL